MPACALEVVPAGESFGSFVRGGANALQLNADDWSALSVAPTAREMRSPATALSGEPGLLSFTPSFTFRGLAAGFGGQSSTTPSIAGDIDTMRLGGGIGFGAWRFAGAVETNSEAGADLGARQRGFDVGASYDIGNFTTGLTWSRGIYRDFVNAGAPAASDEVSLSLSYRLGRGIDIIGAMQFGETDSKAARAAGESSSSSFIFGTAIRF
jgi:predicted porin